MRWFAPPFSNRRHFLLFDVRGFFFSFDLLQLQLKMIVFSSLDVIICSICSWYISHHLHFCPCISLYSLISFNFFFFFHFHYIVTQIDAICIVKKTYEMDENTSDRQLPERLGIRRFATLQKVGLVSRQ
jgi:hypothetical protein